MPSPVHRLLNTAKHDRHIRAQSYFVGNLMALEPLFGIDFVGAQDRPDLIIQDLGRGTRKGAQSGFLHAKQVLTQRLTQSARPFGNFKGGESVDVHFRDSGFYGTADLDVVVTVKIGMDPTLKANFGGPEGCSLAYPFGNLIIGQQIRGPAQIQGHRPFGETTEGALESADIRVVDIAVVDERNFIAIYFCS